MLQAISLVFLVKVKFKMPLNGESDEPSVYLMIAVTAHVATTSVGEFFWMPMSQNIPNR